MAYLQASDIPAGARGVRSSVDVVPTIIGLLGEAVPAQISGNSLLG